MKLATRIMMLIFIFTVLVGIFAVMFSGPVIKEGFKQIDKSWGKTLAFAVSEGVAVDTINGNSNNVRKILDEIVNENDELTYAYVVDFNNKVFAHTFKKGFPKKLVEFIQSTNIEYEHNNDLHNHGNYFSSNEIILDGENIDNTSYPIIEGMSAAIHLGINDSADKKLVAIVNQKLFQIILTIGFLGMLIAIPFSRQLTQPLERLGTLMQDYGNNKFDGIIKIPRGSEEIRKLGNVFNQMVESRSASEAELKLYRDNLESLVKDRTSEMAIARDVAERANMAKSEFLSRMSHELRTPMNAILGFGQLLEMDEDSLNESQQTNVKEIMDAGHHLLILINEVLDLAKIESGKLDVSIEDILVKDALQQCITILRPQIEARHVELINNIKDESHIVQADFTRFKQVLMNLLSNAVKYNREHGSIILETKITNDHRLQICVTDTGDGITNDGISQLFTSFERLNKVDNVEGTGIGLVITKHLVELMGGSIGVKSTVGQGSTFWVELPLAIKN